MCNLHPICLLMWTFTHQSEARNRSVYIMLHLHLQPYSLVRPKSWRWQLLFSFVLCASLAWTHSVQNQAPWKTLKATSCVLACLRTVTTTMTKAVEESTLISSPMTMSQLSHGAGTTVHHLWWWTSSAPWQCGPASRRMEPRGSFPLAFNTALKTCRRACSETGTIASLHSTVCARACWSLRWRKRDWNQQLSVCVWSEQSNKLIPLSNLKCIGLIDSFHLLKKSPDLQLYCAKQNLFISKIKRHSSTVS